MAVTFSLSKAGLEVYTTEPMETQTTTPTTEDSEESEDTTATIGSEDINTSSNFILQNGETKQIDYIGELYSDSFEMDYADILSN